MLFLLEVTFRAWLYAPAHCLLTDSSSVGGDVLFGRALHHHRLCGDSLDLITQKYHYSKLP